MKNISQLIIGFIDNPSGALDALTSGIRDGFEAAGGNSEY